MLVLPSKGSLNFKNINTNILNVNDLKTDNLITNQVFINTFNNLNGNVDAINLNVEHMDDYQNIKSNNLFIEQEIRELKNIPYANVGCVPPVTDPVTYKFPLFTIWIPRI